MQKMQFSNTDLIVVHNTIKFDALIALTSLGFDKKNAEKAIDKVGQENDTVEQIIKAALKIL
jgi:Holliday junction DNA helicase RuvA